MLDVFCDDSAWAPLRHKKITLEQVSKGILFKDREAYNFLLKLKVLIFCSSSSYMCVFVFK